MQNHGISENDLETPILCRGKQEDMLRTSKMIDNHAKKNVLLTTSQKHTVLKESWPFSETFKKYTKAPHLPSPGNHSPSALGKLVRVPASLNHHLAFFFFFLFLLSFFFYFLHSCIQFSVLGVLKGTFILGPGFSSFMVIQLPPRAKECFKSLKASKEN